MDAKDAAEQFYLPLQTPLDGVLVLRRAQVLACLVCRGGIESGAGHVEAESVHQKMLAWITASDLWAEMEPGEEVAVRAPLGALTEADVIRTTWLVEGLAILSWAINQFDLPIHDVQVDPFHVAESVGFLPDWDELINAVPRNGAELSAYREFIYAIHSRLRDFERNHQSKDFASWIEPSWVEVLGVDGSHLMADGDLAIDGKTLAFATENRVAECLWLTYQRHKAIVWLVEGRTIYSQVSADI